MPTEPTLFTMPDPMALVLGASGFFAVLLTLRFVVATMLPAGHRLSRAAEAIDAPFWAAKASDNDVSFPPAGPSDGSTGRCD